MLQGWDKRPVVTIMILHWRYNICARMTIVLLVQGICQSKHIMHCLGGCMYDFVSRHFHGAIKNCWCIIPVCGCIKFLWITADIYMERQPIPCASPTFSPAACWWFQLSNTVAHKILMVKNWQIFFICHYFISNKFVCLPIIQALFM